MRERPNKHALSYDASGVSHKTNISIISTGRRNARVEPDTRQLDRFPYRLPHRPCTVTWRVPRPPKLDANVFSWHRPSKKTSLTNSMQCEGPGDGVTCWSCDATESWTTMCFPKQRSSNAQVHDGVVGRELFSAEALHVPNTHAVMSPLAIQLVSTRRHRNVGRGHVQQHFMPKPAGLHRLLRRHLVEFVN